MADARAGVSAIGPRVLARDWRSDIQVLRLFPRLTGSLSTVTESQLSDGHSETLFIGQPLQQLSSAASERPPKNRMTFCDDNFHSCHRPEPGPARRAACEARRQLEAVTLEVTLSLRTAGNDRTRIEFKLTGRPPAGSPSPARLGPWPSPGGGPGPLGLGVPGSVQPAQGPGSSCSVTYCGTSLPE